MDWQRLFGQLPADIDSRVDFLILNFSFQIRWMSRNVTVLLSECWVLYTLLLLQLTESENSAVCPSSLRVDLRISWSVCSTAAYNDRKQRWAECLPNDEHYYVSQQTFPGQVSGYFVPKNVPYIDIWSNTPISLDWLSRHVTAEAYMALDRLWYRTDCVVRSCPFSCSSPASCLAELSFKLGAAGWGE